MDRVEATTCCSVVTVLAQERSQGGTRGCRPGSGEGGRGGAFLVFDRAAEPPLRIGDLAAAGEPRVVDLVRTCF